MRRYAQGGSLTDEKRISLSISDVQTEAGAQELVRSERMKPYLALLKAQDGGQDIQPHMAALAGLPLEDRYVWRVISALKWAFCDLETESASANRLTLSTEDLKKVTEPLGMRAIQFCLFAGALLGEDAMEEVMTQAIRSAKAASAAASAE